MADLKNKYPENAVGRYYVDNNCIDCDLCRMLAPYTFTRNMVGGYSVVFKQPDDSEVEKAQEALESCPVDAIGNDGELD